MWLCRLQSLAWRGGFTTVLNFEFGAVCSTRRLLCSTPADEINAEMAQFGIGGLPRQAHGQAPDSLQQQNHQQQQQVAGQGWGTIGDAAAGTAGAAAPSSPGAPPPQLAAEVHAVNSELFGFFGAPPSQPDASGGSAAGGLARQLAALAGQDGPAGGLGAAAKSAQAPSGSYAASGSSGSGSSSSSQHTATQESHGASSSSGGAGEDGGRLTHVDTSGRAAMVDVSHKADTRRTATAGARVLLGQHVYDLVASNQLAKGDVLTVAQLAGVMGAKHTSALIPLCHNILLSRVHVGLALAPEAAAVDITATATTVGPTGVEMEALTAAAVAALTVYDMCKAASKGVVITDLRLLAKAGGKSGDWVAPGGDSLAGAAK